MKYKISFVYSGGRDIVEFAEVNSYSFDHNNGIFEYCTDGGGGIFFYVNHESGFPIEKIDIDIDASDVDRKVMMKRMSGVKNIDIIKFYREQTGCSLKESKERVDEILSGETHEVWYC